MKVHWRSQKFCVSSQFLEYTFLLRRRCSLFIQLLIMYIMSGALKEKYIKRGSHSFYTPTLSDI